MSDVYKLVAETLASHMGVDPATIKPEATLNDLELDSLTVVELGMILEDKYGISFNENGLNMGMTLAELISQMETAPAR